MLDLRVPRHPLRGAIRTSSVWKNGRFFLSLLVLPHFFGCAAGITPEAPEVTPSAESREAAGEFLVQAGDVLIVTVWPATELSGDFPIEDTGLVHLPGVGAIDVGNRTLREVRADLRERYGEALRSPVVTVTPRFRISILGAVTSPGLYQVEPSMSLFDVISMAGWFRDDARADEVKILRSGRILEFDAEAALRSGGDEFGQGLRSGDRIIVPEQWFRLGGARDLLILGNFVTLLVGLGTRIF